MAHRHRDPDIPGMVSNHLVVIESRMPTDSTMVLSCGTRDPSPVVFCSSDQDSFLCTSCTCRASKSNHSDQSPCVCTCSRSVSRTAVKCEVGLSKSGNATSPCPPSSSLLRLIVLSAAARHGQQSSPTLATSWTEPFEHRHRAHDFAVCLLHCQRPLTCSSWNGQSSCCRGWHECRPPV